jgi:hypothetical protein
MEVSLLESLAQLRTLVGFLGERAQFGWWQSSFFAPGSSAFLAPIFGRTQLLAQVTGVSGAAVLVHDERIGVGNVYHLFRLPEEMEQGIHRVLQRPELAAQISAMVAGREAALANLGQEAGAQVTDGLGPTRIGNIADLRNLGQWRTAAGQYLRSFEQGTEVYPYFADRAA